MKRLLLVAVILTVLVVVIVVGIKALRHNPDGATLSRAQPAVVVVVDPAHGGRDPGANSGGTLGKDVTLAIANRVSALAAGYPGLKVVLTRTSDTDLASDERLAVATQENAALYLAINVNAFSQPTATGVETLVDSGHSSGDPSWAFAKAVEKAVIASTQAKERGVRAQDLFLKRLTIPAVATEVGFITSPDERAKLLDPAYQDLVAQGILQGLTDYVAAAGITPTTVVTTTPAQGSARSETSTSSAASSSQTTQRNGASVGTAVSPSSRATPGQVGSTSTSTSSSASSATRTPQVTSSPGTPAASGAATSSAGSTSPSPTKSSSPAKKDGPTI